MKLISGAGGIGGGGTKKPRAPITSPDSAFLRSISFAQMQFLLCEGPIWGPKEGRSWGGLLASTYLDDTPLSVRGLGGTVPVEDLVLSYGTFDQTAVPGYGVQWNTIGVGQSVKASFPVFATAMPSDPTTQHRARVVLTWEALLVAFKQTGDVVEAQVPYLIDYTDANGVVRLVFAGFTFGKFSGPFQREHEWDLAGPGPWVVRVMRMAADDDALETPIASFRSAFSFTNLSFGPVLSLGRRYSATLTLAARADRYSNLPAVAIDLYGKICKVPTNYDPWAGTYSGVWDGSFKEDWTDNPAWCFYDMVTNPRYGLGESIDPVLIDKWSLYSIGQYCDGLVPAVGGGLERRFRCNLILAAQNDAWVVLQQLASIFRGQIFWSAGLVVSTQDAPGDFLYTFNPSNVEQTVDDSGAVVQPCFEYEGTAKRTRHTVCLVSWDDPANAYQPRVEYIADSDALARLGYRPLELRLNGITTRGQALRTAQWALLSEAILDDTVTFKVGAIGMALRPGDLVKVMDPDKGGVRFGGRVVAQDGDTITLDAAPPTPLAGWAGGLFYWQSGAGLPRVNVAGVSGAVVTVSGWGDDSRPTPGMPWLLEVPNLEAQPFRILGIEELGQNRYAVTALRYRSDIYDRVDFDTPLSDDEDYLFKLLDPLPPTILNAQIVWDNSQAKLEVNWRPQDRVFVDGGFDLSTSYHRLQYQRGEVGAGGEVTWTNQWAEVDRQTDTTETIPLVGYQAQTRYKVRMASVGKAGAESLWSAELEATPLEVWFPIPDFESIVPHPGGETGPAGVLSHTNLATGGHLWTWKIFTQVPPYARSIEVWGRPVGVPLPDGVTTDEDGYILLGTAAPNAGVEALLPVAATWDVRARLTTFVPGLEGRSFMLDMVDRLEIVPPTPTEFRLVTEQDGQSRMGSRRFSWLMPDPPPFAERWGGGLVSDIAGFEVRYRSGVDVGWEGAFPLLSDGVPGDTFWFETHLMDYGTFTVMLRARDRTGWVSDEMAVVTVGIGQPLPTNVLTLLDLSLEGWPGDLANGTVVGSTSPLFYFPPTTEDLYEAPLEEAIYSGRSGGELVQNDPAQPMVYRALLEVEVDGSALLIYTESDTGSYRWRLEDISTVGLGLRYVAPTTDPMYDVAEEAPFHLGEFLSGGAGLHPYAPHQKLTAGLWQISLEAIASTTNVPARIQDVDVVLDVPDVVWTIEDYEAGVGVTSVPLPPGLFRRVKAVSMAVQDDTVAAGVAVGGRIVYKGTDRIDLRTVDASGADTAALVDLIVVGY
ncbi:host specificity protein J [Cyanophage S-2L]|nr:host specificity protein J [Cyanophage S-2L]